MVESTAIYMASNAISGAFSLLLLPFMTRALTPADFGTLAMFSVFQSVLSPLIGLSTKSAITSRFFHAGQKELGQFVATCLALAAASAAVVFMLISAFGSLLAAMTTVPRLWLLVAVVGGAGQFVITVQLALWQARRMPLRFSQMVVVQSALGFGLTLLLVLQLGFNWEGAAIGRMVAVTACACVAFVCLRRASDLVLPPRCDDVREALTFSLPLIPQALGGVVILVADRVLLTGFLDVEQTGLYAAALQLSMVLGVLIDAFNRAYVPWLFARLKEDAPGFRLQVVRGIYLYALVAAAIAGMVALASPLVAAIFLGEMFQQAAAFIPYLAAGFVFNGLYYMMASIILFSRQTARLTIVTVSAGLLHILISAFLIVQNGPAGAAQGFMISQAFLFLITWLAALGALPMPWFGRPATSAQTRC